MDDKRRRDRRYDAERRASQPYRRWYKTRAWKHIRALRLAEEPLCRMCNKQGKVASAVAVDHIEPHKGDWDLFVSYENTQSLCSYHHNSVKQSEEHHGYSKEVGSDGWPTDPRHPANAHAK